MAISLQDNLDIRNKKQNVERDSFKTIEEMRSFPSTSLPPVFHAMCEDDGCLYIYNVNNSENDTTGKWRKFECSANGTGGTNGKDGVSPTVSITTTDTGHTVKITDVNGVNSFDVLNGKDGINGTNGQNGVDGIGISKIEKTKTEGLVDTYTITFSDDSTFDYTVTNGKNGKDGSGSSTGEKNIIEEIKVNGTPLTPDENKSVDITIPSVDVDKDYVDTELTKKADTTAIPSLDGYVTEEALEAKGYLTEHQDISGKVDKVKGKSLIDDSEIERLKNVKNYDDSDIKADLDKKADKTEIPTIPTLISSFTNDKGYMTEFTETDPTVPAWAKTENKPSYTAAEVGALPEDTEIPIFINKTVLDGITNEKIKEWDAKSDFDGDYNSLINKPDTSNSEETKTHILTDIYGEEGVHGFRYYNNTLQVQNAEGDWFDVISGGGDSSNIHQLSFLNVRTNDVKYLNLDVGNVFTKSLIQAYKFIPGQTNIVETLKSFNNADASNFNYNDKNVEFTYNGMGIKDNYELTMSKYNDELYITEAFNKDDFVDISSIE